MRRGYTKTSLIELCNEAGLNIEEISFCSGFLSQKICYLQKKISIISPILGWLAILPIRFFIPAFDKLLSKLFYYPNYSICLEAYKPRFK